jgi:glycosyltransferase involved in cell wall biosynthesis
MPRVSILMPVHNGEKYLAATLDSLLGQTFTDFELLVNDDGSQDNTPAILSAYSRRDSRIVPLRNESNKGIAATVNALFPRARGEYVTRQDSDDLAEPELLERLVAFLDANPNIGLVACQVNWIDGQGKLFAEEPASNARLTNDELQTGLLVNNCLATGSVMVRRELLDRAGNYDEGLLQVEDYDLWLRVAEVTRLARLPEKLHYYRKHSESITRRRHHQTHYEVAQVLERSIRRRNLGASIEHRHAAAKAYLDAAIAKAGVGELPAVWTSIRKVLELEPGLLTAQPANLEALLMAYTTAAPRDAAANFVAELFAELPTDRALRRVRRRWLSRVYMRAVFAGAARMDHGQVRANLWKGLRHDPRWLLNRGVLSILARTLVKNSG